LNRSNPFGGWRMSLKHGQHILQLSFVFRTHPRQKSIYANPRGDPAIVMSLPVASGSGSYRSFDIAAGIDPD